MYPFNLVLPFMMISRVLERVYIYIHIHTRVTSGWNRVSIIFMNYTVVPKVPVSGDVGTSVDTSIYTALGAFAEGRKWDGLFPFPFSRFSDRDDRLDLANWSDFCSCVGTKFELPLDRFEILRDASC